MGDAEREPIGYEVLYREKGEWKRYDANFNANESGAANRRALQLSLISEEARVKPVYKDDSLVTAGSSAALSEDEVKRCARALIMADALDFMPPPPVGPQNADVAKEIRFLVGKLEELTGQ